MIARSRIESRFASLKRQERAGLVTFITAGDPDLGTSMELLRRLPLAGADIIELGMPFSDPMADGPAIQASSLRALKAGQTMRRTLDMVAAFRRQDGETPLILMGYFNPVCSYGINRFVTDARTAGVDGLIIVDLPPEEADELLIPARKAGLHIVFLAAPTTDEKRLTRVLGSAQGFLYYVSITGITGAGSAARDDIAAAISRIREQTSLPIAVGFGIRTPEQVRQIAPIADAVVVGSAIVDIIAKHANSGHGLRETMVDSVTGFCGQLSTALRTAPARERS